MVLDIRIIDDHQAIGAGASGYGSKDRAYEEFVPAIGQIHSGARYFGRGVVQHNP